MQQEESLLTFLSFVYLSSGVSSPLVSALTFGPSLIPNKNKQITHSSSFGNNQFSWEKY